LLKSRFDFVCGLGSACIASQALREASLQYASFPFDWLSGPTFSQRIQSIVDDFIGWFEAGDLECIGNPNHFTHDSYRNHVTNAVFPHDFDQGRAFDEIYPIVKEKYERRIRRLYDCIRRSQRVLFVWLENPSDDDRPDETTVLRALQMLSAKFPGVAFSFLVIDRAQDDEGNGIVRRTAYGWRVACGYRRKTIPGASARPWDLELDPIVSILNGFSARDYRSSAEKRAHRRSKRQKRYGTMKASNLVGYLVTKVQVKLCRHLRKRLLRRGIVMAEGA